MLNSVVFRITLSALIFLAGFGVSQAGEFDTSARTRSGITFARMMRPTNMPQIKIAGAEYIIATQDEWIAVHPETSTKTPIPRTVVVRKGDTLSQLFGVEKYRLVAEFNGITNPDRIFVGQTITLPPGVTVITHAKQHAVRTQSVHAIATPARPEFVETKFGTAWVYPGTNRAEVTRETLAWSAPDIATSTILAMKRWISTNQIPEEARESLLDRIAGSDRTVVALSIGDRYDAILFAGNDYREHVLAAWSEQRHYHGLCYGVRVRNMDHLMIRELASGNWIFHSLPTTGTEVNTACERLRRSD